MSLASPLNVWPDYEALLVGWLGGVAGLRVVTRTDETLSTPGSTPSMQLPLVLVQRAPGGSLSVDQSTEIADVNTVVYALASDRTGLWATQQKVHARMFALAGSSTPQGAVDEVEVFNGWGTWNTPNPLVLRAAASYRLHARPFKSL